MAAGSPVHLPRVVVAGLSGDSGKTLVALGAILLARNAGLPVGAFKKGPDYIDAAWLTWASGRPARHLDSYLMGWEKVAGSFVAHADPGGLNVIEGNRGLYDGFDARGTHSTAELAKHLQAPVVLVVNAMKVSRTAAALVLGCQTLDPGVRIAGAVLNRVVGSRHERLLRAAVADVCGLPVFGAIPRARTGALLPGRHLGLVTPEEHPEIGALKQDLLALLDGHLDLAGILGAAKETPPLPQRPGLCEFAPDGRGLTIGYLRDSAFTFYYPENLEQIERSGATLVPISSLSGGGVPECLNALYIGGGFPETHGPELSSNRPFLESIRRSVERGLPVYAECGGLMLLARTMTWQGRRYAMAGVLPVDVEVCDIPQGHGYVELEVDQPNPFFPVGLALRGHEFHYSRVVPDGSGPLTACRVTRGAGTSPGRDGITVGNVWAGYTHVHAIATPEWITGLIAAARRRAAPRAGSSDGSIPHGLR